MMDGVAARMAPCGEPRVTVQAHALLRNSIPLHRENAMLSVGACG